MENLYWPKTHRSAIRRLTTYNPGSGPRADVTCIDSPLTSDLRRVEAMRHRPAVGVAGDVARPPHSHGGRRSGNDSRPPREGGRGRRHLRDRKSTRLNSS